MKQKYTDLNIYYQNVRGLRTKSKQFFENLICSNSTLLVLTETWLCPDISSSDYFPPSFRVFRSDRQSTEGKRGGGVLVAFDQSYDCVRRTGLETYSESVWVEVRGPKDNILLGAFYFPPHMSPETFHDCLQEIERTVTASDSANVLILGDFNAPSICWKTGKVTSNNFYITTKCDSLVNFSSFLGLTQRNSTPNWQGKFLDLCLTTSETVSVDKSKVPLVPEDKYHPALDIKMTIQTPVLRQMPSGQNVEKSFDYAGGDYVGLYGYFSDFNWSSILESPNVNDQVNQLTAVVQEGMKKFIPLRKNVRSGFPYWFSPELRTALKRKSFLHRKFKKTGRPEFESKFQEVRSRCRALLKRDKQADTEAVESDLQRNPKRFWRGVKSRRGDRAGENAIVMEGNGGSTTDVCNVFAGVFGSVYTVDTGALPTETLPCTNTLSVSNIAIDEVTVETCIKAMRPTLSAGHDGIPQAILKSYGCILTPVLCAIFINCLKSGIFPSIWKIAVVVPIFKAGKRTDASNYRPISLLCSFSKLFEKVIHRSLSFSLQSTIITNQHGFFAGRSTTTNLVAFATAASKVVCDRGQLDVIYFDCSKAFDIVNHSILLSKLSAVGLCGPIYCLLEDYLRERVCYVRANGSCSPTYNATSGVPQGSVLGPLLFSVFVNDVASAITTSSFLLYADDIKIFREIGGEPDCMDLQSDITSFVGWCSRNHLKINHSKTKVMTYSRKTATVPFNYTINTNQLSRVCEIRDLGVVFDSALRFQGHVVHIVKSALRTLGLVCRVSREFRDPKTFLTLYCSLCRSHLEYASVVWGGTCHSNLLRISRVQAKFVSIFKHRFNFAKAVDDVHSSPIRLQDLQGRRNTAELLFLYKCIHGQIDSSDILHQVSLHVPRVTTRKTSTFYLSSRVNTLDPVSRAELLYNNSSLNLDIFLDNFSDFVKSVRKLFCDF